MNSVERLVSVIVPVYNRVEYVAETIESILAQTYESLELVLINDGSTDDSLAILKAYQQRFPDKIVVIDQTNQGQIAARNNGIKQASGHFIAFLDSDDLWYPEKLALQIPLFQNANIGLVYCAIENIDANGAVISTEMCDEKITDTIYEHLLVQNRMTGGSVVVTKTALDDVGLFDPAFKAAENWDLWLRVTQKYKAALVNKVLVKYRMHAGNMSKNSLLMLEAKENIINKHSDLANDKPALRGALLKARADLAYRYGLYYSLKGDYSLARKFFKTANRFVPGYKDVNQRIYRSYLGKSVNMLLSFFKHKLART